MFIASCKPLPSDLEVQPNITKTELTVLSSNENTVYSGAAFKCPNGIGGARSTIYYSVKLSTIGTEEYLFDSVWVARRSPLETTQGGSYDTIAHNLSKTSAKAFKLTQTQDRNSYTLSVVYSPDPCRGLGIDTTIKLPITPDVVASGVISYTTKTNSIKRYLIFKDVVVTRFFGQ